MFDEQLTELLKQEQLRQENCIELIASENYASAAVMAAQGSILTNKYAEGYPFKRYYGGCEWVDEVEKIAIERACKLFDCKYANVQPHSGSQANMAVFTALLEPGDCILGMNLNAGGHLTHGASVSASGRIYQAVHYGVNAFGLIDYAEVEKLALAHKPKLIIAGFSAYSGVIDWAKFRVIADKVGAYLLADIAHVAGLIAAKLYPSPLKHAHIVTSTTHKTLRGPRGGLILSNGDEELQKKLNFGIFPCTQGGPFMHSIMAKAVAFNEALQPDFVIYQQRVIDNARIMADRLMQKGLDVVSNGTKNHMFLLDFSNCEFSGKQVEAWLELVNITANKNTVPGEKRSPFQTSGLRIGTPAITTRGMQEQEMLFIADAIVARLNDVTNEKLSQQIKQEIIDLCGQFPVNRG
jgi:glycine hydroxymethyltransferase